MSLNRDIFHVLISRLGKHSRETDNFCLESVETVVLYIRFKNTTFQDVAEQWRLCPRSKFYAYRQTVPHAIQYREEFARDRYLQFKHSLWIMQKKGAPERPFLYFNHSLSGQEPINGTR